MDGDSDVGEDRRRPHRRHGDVTRAVRERVTDVVERVVDVRVLDLEIRDGAAAAWAPVDDAVRAVDPAAPVEMHEEAQHGPDVALVHREALAPVVERGPQPAVLVHDHAAEPLEPLPDARLERLAAEILPGEALLGQIPLDDVLGPDPGVVVARLPEDVEAPHPVPADEHVLVGRVHGVAHVQLARDVRGRDRDRVRRPARARLRRVEALLLPRALPALLDQVRAVLAVHPGHCREAPPSS